MIFSFLFFLFQLSELETRVVDAESRAEKSGNQVIKARLSMLDLQSYGDLALHGPIIDFMGM